MPTNNHTSAAFNHSCLKMPVNPINQLPYTCHERKGVIHVPQENSTNKERSKKNANFKGETNSVAQTLSTRCESILEKENNRERFSGLDFDLHVLCNNNSKDSFESFLDFYVSIPDYRDVKYLSDKDFSMKLQLLKDKQKMLLGNNPINMGLGTCESKMTSKDCHTPLETAGSNTLNDYINHDKKNNSFKTNHVRASLYKPGPRPRSSPVNNLNSKQYDKENKREHHSRVHYEPQHDSYMNAHHSVVEKETFKGSVGTPSTISLSSEAMSQIGSCEPLKQTASHINSYLSDSDGAYGEKSKSNRLCNVNEMIFKEKYRTTSKPYRPAFKRDTILREQKQGTSSTCSPHTQSPCSNNRTTTVDFSKADTPISIVDRSCTDIWYRFNADESMKSGHFYSDLDSLLDEPLLSRSVPSSPTFKLNKSVVWKEPKITVPKPFNMTLRDENNSFMNKHDIYSNLIDDLNLKDEKRGNFKANPVPIESRIPLFEKIMYDQEMRRQKVKKQAVAELKSQMRPFSFVNYEKNCRQHRLCCSTPELRALQNDSSKSFKARPVPKNLFGSLVYQRMREDEYYRTLKKKIRAEELLKASSLPPSMAAREQISRIMSACKMSSDDSIDRQPKRPRCHKIPNYKAAHSLMRQELAERQQENITTSPQPFHLRTGELRSRVKRSSASSSPYECYSSLTSHDRRRPGSAVFLSGNRNNLAAILRIQSARKRLEQEVMEKKEEMKKQEEAKMKALTTRRNPVWQALNYSVQEDLAIRIQTRREEERLRRERHQHEMDLMLDRVDRIPPLFLRQSRDNVVQKKGFPKSESKGMKKHQLPLAYSSPDLFGGMDDIYLSDESDDRGLKTPAKVVSINENTQTFGSKQDKQEQEPVAPCNDNDNSMSQERNTVEIKESTGSKEEVKEEDCNEESIEEDTVEEENDSDGSSEREGSSVESLRDENKGNGNGHE